MEVLHAPQLHSFSDVSLAGVGSVCRNVADINVGGMLRQWNLRKFRGQHYDRDR